MYLVKIEYNCFKREERREFDKLDAKIRPIMSTEERNDGYKEHHNKNKNSINKRRRKTWAYDKLMQELPFYCVPITVVLG